MNNLKYQAGSTLLPVVWVILIITSLLIAAGAVLNVKRNVVRRFLTEEELRRAGDDVFHSVIHWLKENDKDYDTPEEKTFPSASLGELGYPGATVEIWDEGSRFNPNNATKAQMLRFFAKTPGLRRAVIKKLFGEGTESGRVTTLARQDYFLTKEELLSIGESDEELELLEECTVFGPAVYYLTDGEVFLSLLYRAGEEFDIPAEQKIINTFNQKLNELPAKMTLDGLLTHLKLDILPNLEFLGNLVTVEGFINPNYATSHYLESVLSTVFGGIKLDGFEEFRKENPFKTKESFESYLNAVYRKDLPAMRIWRYFSLKTRIWGIKITLPSEENGLKLEINAVIERISDESSSANFKILSFKSEIISSKNKEKNVGT